MLLAWLTVCCREEVNENPIWYIYARESGVFLRIFCACRKRFRPSRGVGLLQRRIHYNNINIFIRCSENRRRAPRARCAAPAILFSLIKPSSGATMIFHILRPLRQYLCIYSYIHCTESLKNWYVYVQRTRETRLRRGGGDMCRSVGRARRWIYITTRSRRMGPRRRRCRIVLVVVVCRVVF